MSIALNTRMPGADAWQTLRRHGKTFCWAAHLMPRRDALRLARLYATCRAIDDLADLDGGTEAGARLTALLTETWAAESDDPLTASLAWLTEEAGVSPATMRRLIEGVIGDLRPALLQDEAELIRYAYRVAGTVGLMVCDVLGVTAPLARDAAVHLGIAMQLTNIARDVMEDARAGRRYLPASWWNAAPAAITAASAEDRASGSAAILRLLDLADRYYDSAASGYHYLPVSSRLAMVVAARVYRGIGTELRRRNGDYAMGRAYVSRARKVLLTAKALGLVIAGGEGGYCPGLSEPIRDLLPENLRHLGAGHAGS